MLGSGRLAQFRLGAERIRAFGSETRTLIFWFCGMQSGGSIHLRCRYRSPNPNCENHLLRVPRPSPLPPIVPKNRVCD